MKIEFEINVRMKELSKSTSGHYTGVSITRYCNGIRGELRPRAHMYVDFMRYNVNVNCIEEHSIEFAWCM